MNEHMYKTFEHMDTLHLEHGITSWHRIFFTFLLCPTLIKILRIFGDISWIGCYSNTINIKLLKYGPNYVYDMRVKLCASSKVCFFGWFVFLQCVSIVFTIAGIVCIPRIVCICMQFLGSIAELLHAYRTHKDVWYGIKFIVLTCAIDTCKCIGCGATQRHGILLLVGHFGGKWIKNESKTDSKMTLLVDAMTI